MNFKNFKQAIFIAFSISLTAFTYGQTVNVKYGRLWALTSAELHPGFMIKCNSRVFGVDPLPRQPKYCYINDKIVAAENEYFIVPDHRADKKGEKSNVVHVSYNKLNSTASSGLSVKLKSRRSYICNTSLFGKDPFPNKAKGCAVNGDIVAVEGEVFYLQSVYDIPTEPNTDPIVVTYKVDDVFTANFFTPGFVYKCETKVFAGEYLIHKPKSCFMGGKLLAREGEEFFVPYPR